MQLLALLPLAAGGCHKLSPELPALQTVTLTGTAVAPADQVADLLPATPALQLARRAGQPDVPLAYARVQALDASLKPIPGVPEARTDARGQFMLDVQPGQFVVMRFSVKSDERQLELLAMAHPQDGGGPQVVNADAASHVATKVILGRAGGLDAALQALGAPELQVAVDAIRRGLADKIPLLTSPEDVDKVVAAEQADVALSPVLERVDRAAALAAAISPPPLVTSRIVAAAMPATADTPTTPAPSPTPVSSPTPPPADAYRVEPKAETQPEPPAGKVAARTDAHAWRRRAVPVVDPFWAARERAYVRIHAPIPARVRLPEGRGLDPDPRRTAAAAAAQQEPRARTPAIQTLEAQVPRIGQPAGQTSPRTPAKASKPRIEARPNQHLALLASLPDGVTAVRREVAHESARPVAVESGAKRGPLGRFMDFLARWLPRFQPPTGARPS